MANEARFEVYPLTRNVPPNEDDIRREPTGEFGWRFRAANGQITAIGGEGFSRREDAERAIKHFMTDIGADHEDEWASPPILDVDE